MNNGFIKYNGQKREREKYPDGIRLPWEYVRCSYIVPQTSFAGYIDTGLKADYNDEYIITCRRWSGDNNNRPVFGDGASKTDSNIALWLHDKTNLVEFTFGDGGKNDYKVLTSNYKTTDFHTYRMQNWTGKAWLDGNYIGQSKLKSTVSNSKRLVFVASWRNTSANGYFYGDVGEFIIIRNGVKIRHFVPCVRRRKQDGINAGFYDICGSSSPSTGTPFYIPTAGSNRGLYSDPCDPDKDADIQLDVNIADAGAVFSLARMKFGNYTRHGISIDWGDGVIEKTTGETNQNGYSHTYAAPGIYRVRVQNISMINFFQTSNSTGTQNCVINVKMVRYGNMYNDGIRLAGSVYARICDASITGNPDGVYYCFMSNCQNSMIRHLPDSISSISQESFYRNERLSLSRLPSSLTSIGKRAFSMCKSIRKISFPDTITSIGDESFSSCESLDADSLPENLANVGNSAFRQCDLSSLTALPGTITSIGNYAFCETGLLITSIDMPDLVSLGENAFESCQQMPLATFNAPKLTSIPYKAFKNCSKLCLTSLPGNIKTIDIEAFRNDAMLALTSLPSTLTGIRGMAFLGCSSLAISSIEAPDLAFIDGLAFAQCNSMQLSSIVAPKLTFIGDQAFSRCYGLTLTSLPDSMETIDSNAFYYCVNLALESLPKGLRTIGKSAFEGCVKITSDLVIPPSVRTMGQNAFKSVTFDTVRFLGKPDTVRIDGSVNDVYVPWSEGEADLSGLNAGSPTIHYDCDVIDYYINDSSLVGWYDGIKNTRSGHAANAAKWEDLSYKRHDLTLYLDHCGVESDHLHLNGTGLAAEDKTYRMYSNNYTIEIMYSRGPSVLGMVMCGFNSSYSNSVIYTDANGACCISGSLSGSTPRHGWMLEEGVASYLARVGSKWTTNLYLNSERTEESGMDEMDGGFDMGNGTSAKPHIGDVDTSDLPSSPGNGDVYCIRFYNRMLTAQEIAYNYNLDRVRFRTYRQESSSSSGSSN